jgi:choline dehydrogenase
LQGAVVPTHLFHFATLFPTTAAPPSNQSAPAFAKYAPVEHFPGPGIVSDDDMLESAKHISTTIFHPVGTCRMGRFNHEAAEEGGSGTGGGGIDAGDDDIMAVVDSRLRVRGVGGLRVVDASVMPQITSGNTNSPTIMIAEKLARELLQKQQPQR